jgi:hypothetical protein
MLANLRPGAFFADASARCNSLAVACHAIYQNYAVNLFQALSLHTKMALRWLKTLSEGRFSPYGAIVLTMKHFLIC